MTTSRNCRQTLQYQVNEGIRNAYSQVCIILKKKQPRILSNPCPRGLKIRGGS
jgi:hypothetical protein